MLKIISWRDRRAEVILPFYLSRQKKILVAASNQYSPNTVFSKSTLWIQETCLWNSTDLGWFPPPPIRIFKKWNKKQLKNYSSSSKRITVNHMLLLINKGKPTTTHLVFKILSNWQRTHNSVYFKLFFLFY